MFQNTSRNRGIVGGAAGLTFALAFAVAVGIVPHAGANSSDTQLTAASAAPTVPVAAPDAPPATDAPAPAPEVAPEAPAPVSHHSSSAPAASSDSEAAAPSSDSAPAPAAAAPTGVARTTPSSAQVQAAIQGIHARIPLFTPTAAQVAQLGDQVCTAFDQGQSYAQVKAAGMQQIAQYPFVTVTSADADWMIHTAVSMYCPGHADKLS